MHVLTCSKYGPFYSDMRFHTSSELFDMAFCDDRSTTGGINLQSYIKGDIHGIYLYRNLGTANGLRYRHIS